MQAHPPLYMRVWAAVPLIWPLAALATMVTFKTAPWVGYAFGLLSGCLGLILIGASGKPVADHLETPPPAKAWRLVGGLFIAAGVGIPLVDWQLQVRASAVSVIALALVAIAVFAFGITLYRRYGQYNFWKPKS